MIALALPQGPAAALDDGQQVWSFDALHAEVAALATHFRAQDTQVLATLLDNSPAWVVADLAAAAAGIVHVPLPLFFTPAQIRYALRAAGVDTLLTSAQAASLWPDGPRNECRIAGETLATVRLPAVAAPMPAQTTKITFTSGTTGAPKGVCLTAGAMEAVAAGLGDVLAPLQVRRHLCALPLAVLLENIAGVLAPLCRGATCVVRPLAALGLNGSSQFDAARFHATVIASQPDSMILLPQMLRVWVDHLLQSNQRPPAGLRMVAVGGASVGARLLDAAHALGVPACEGYGLSEGASVQTLNLPGAQRRGSAGRVLPHARLRIAPDGEVEVAGSLFAGYLGSTEAPSAWWPTGDLGALDADGFLHIQGRKKHVLITSFGRNVSPEWVETALRGEPAIAEAVVFGDGEPALGAVLWSVRAGVSDAALQAAVDAANARLPDYARVEHWTRGLADFSPATGLATPNGRPQRAAIQQMHAHALAARSQALA